MKFPYRVLKNKPLEVYFHFSV